MKLTEPQARLERLLLRVGTTPGQLLWAAFAVVAASGVALGALYDPGAPLASVEVIQRAAPLGWAIRAVHRLSANAMLVLLLLHTIDHLIARSYRRSGAAAWWRLVGVLVLGVGAMLGGFLLRGDAESHAAHAVAIGVTRAVPGIGADLAAFLWGTPGGSLHVVYLHHLVTFTLLPWLLAIEHARRAWAGWLVSAALLTAVTALALVVHPGPGLPVGIFAGPLHGPWYLAGLQQGLRWLAPLMAGVAVPLLGSGLLGALGHLPEVPGTPRARGEAALRWALLLLAAAYLLASMVQWLG